MDLFSGCGGLTLGAEEAARRAGLGIDIRLAVERDRDIAAAYAANFTAAHGTGPSSVEDWFDGRPGERLSFVERRTRKAVGEVDLVMGGPPCQGHSTLNNHTRGVDPKNELYLRMVRAAEVLRPECVLIENVPAIDRDASHIVDRATQYLVDIGYQVDAGVVCVADIGVPQLRKRHVLLAHRTQSPSVTGATQFGRIRRPRSLRWAIGDLTAAPGRTLFDTSSLLSRQNLRRARFLQEHALFDLPNRYRPTCQRSEHKYKSMYGRLDWRAPAQTITTGFGSPGQGRYLHPDRLRTLTPHEAARIQFIPDWYDFSSIPHRRALSEAIGNAVPPKLAFVLVTYLLDLSVPARHLKPAFVTGTG